MKTIILWLVLFLFSYVMSCAQPLIITTIAGNGISAFSGDGGPAIVASLLGPRSVAVDNIGNVYISESARIRKINTTGIINTIAGNGTPGYAGDGGSATAALISSPWALALDRPGNVYLCGDAVVRRVNPAGIISTVAGTGFGGSTGDGGPATAARVTGGGGPDGIAIDSAGRIYISDVLNVRDIRAGIINRFAGTGVAGYTGDGGPATIAALNHPWGVATDTFGNIFIADASNNVIRKVDASGIITTIAGTGTAGFSGDGGPATAADLQMPQAIAVDNAGNIFFNDSYNYRLRKISTGGIISTIAGTGTIGYSGDGCAATAAQFSSIYGLALDAAGNIYAASFGYNRLRMISRNHLPAFTVGHTFHLALCAGSGMHAIDSLLSVHDSDRQQPLAWAVVGGPSHGTATGAYAATSMGSVLLPSGLYYSPASGYSGTDTFTIRVSDCVGAADTATIYVTVNPLPVAGPLMGPDSVCVGSTVTLADTAAGGVWYVANGTASMAGGVITGVSPGIDTVLHVVVNSCGADTATRSIVVSECKMGVRALRSNNCGISVSPNPSDGIFTITLYNPIAEEMQITITDRMGRTVKASILPVRQSAQVQDIQLDTPPGIYFLHSNAGNVMIVKNK